MPADMRAFFFGILLMKFVKVEDERSMQYKDLSFTSYPHAPT